MAKAKKIVANDARSIAFQVLCRVEDGAYSDLALDGALDAMPDLDRRERGLATQLVYGVLRRRGNLDHILAAYCRQSLAKLEPQALCLLRLGVYQLFYLDKVPRRAAVHSTVELARQMGLERVTGLVNGILRSCIREPQRVKWPDADVDPIGWLTHYGSLPCWLAKRWLNEFGGEEAGLLAKAMLQVPPVTLRVNTLKIDRDAFIEKLAKADIVARATRFAPEGVVIESGQLRLLSVDDTTLYQIQDEASMLIAHLLAPKAGDRVLDACSAPGGKTTHLAALSNNRAEIAALDLHQKRLTLVQQSAERLGCTSITTHPWDMTQPCSLFPKEHFDRVLVDAPCSGLGVLRRNPESRWRRGEKDVCRLAKLQRKILVQAAELVAPGGLLLYSLCTTTAEESKQVVESFLAQHTDFKQEDLRSSSPDHWAELFDEQGRLSTLTTYHDGMDCFFAVALRRK
ncbi:MAG: 16S rRNA (cytosine(967)-C(5))-methyltransferase RsmB [Thermodesulfobacteriota bacterium]|nr:16S rRNA (cytosine(967)-C(5))-methyltransferase RsmB [Thermodesulfobacteriota bacterium]